MSKQIEMMSEVSLDNRKAGVKELETIVEKFADVAADMMKMYKMLVPVAHFITDRKYVSAALNFSDERGKLIALAKAKMLAKELFAHSVILVADSTVRLEGEEPTEAILTTFHSRKVQGYSYMQPYYRQQEGTIEVIHLLPRERTDTKRKSLLDDFWH